MPVPDLHDPVQRAAYLAELRQVARGTRRSAMGLAILGLLMAVGRVYWWPSVPELVPVILIVAALGLMLVGIVRRTRWHWRRMRGG